MQQASGPVQSRPATMTGLERRRRSLNSLCCQTGSCRSISHPHLRLRRCSRARRLQHSILHRHIYRKHLLTSVTTAHQLAKG